MQLAKNGGAKQCSTVLACRACSIHQPRNFLVGNKNVLRLQCCLCRSGTPSFWTSQPTTWIWMQLRTSRSGLRTIAAVSSWSPMTDTYWTALPTKYWRSTAARPTCTYPWAKPPALATPRILPRASNVKSAPQTPNKSEKTWHAPSLLGYAAVHLRAQLNQRREWMPQKN